MKANFVLFIFFLFSITSFTQVADSKVIRVNNLGYKPVSIKVAVIGSKDDFEVEEFYVCNSVTDKIVFTSKKVKKYSVWGAFKTSFRLDFSEFVDWGSYYIAVKGVKSPIFKINEEIYNGTADYLLHYMRQQRCGYNPVIGDSCHVHDGFIIYHPELDSTHIDVTGGWHDASDYLQYVTTSANAVFQMMFAYQQNPKSFGDEYDKNGKKGKNGIPDIVDEIKWGMDWLIKMNPNKDLMFNQIADDRDHRGFRLPNKDTVSYNLKDLQRPVYFCTGEPQGFGNHKNRSTGVASTAGKFSSAFALGSKILKDFYPEYAQQLKKKSLEAYEKGLEKPGVCQTACGTSPYFYEEDNYADDMQLAAIQLFSLTGNNNYLAEAVEYGKTETITPWMGADTARHYQWYPFVNLGHFYVAESEKPVGKLFKEFMQMGLQEIYSRGKDNPFQIGIPFIWCSNNLVAAALTQARLYNNLTGDSTYLEMEASLRDWLLGCNPWGISMVIGLPEYGNFPKDPHSSLAHLNNFQLSGGLVDGPVYGSIFNNLRGLRIANGDEYADFQSNLVVYHDDFGDYSTNEPTMDGTASLTYYFSSLASGNEIVSINDNSVKVHNGIIRKDTTKKEIYLSFTGGDYSDGGTIIYNTLHNNKIKANFFFTGDFYRSPYNSVLIKRLIQEGHYLGPHSDKHLLYADWTKRDSTLVTKEEFIADLRNNYKEIERFGIDPAKVTYFMPPYEWYNNTISEWASELGVTIVNFTPGTSSNADYTTPDMGERYISSDKIFKNIIEYEKKDPSGLNGFILLIHIGSHPDRTDKFYYKLHELIQHLKQQGYSFKTF